MASKEELLRLLEESEALEAEVDQLGKVTLIDRVTHLELLVAMLCDFITQTTDHPESFLQMLNETAKATIEMKNRS